ncbi:hypothetical protein B0T25DRAFT_508249 [Lasiosphaeria hispida]|uniref:RBR-type E3 ubiquitin transferase n=1 Tax=Lasiosphaeria hispida TaxID=260671 RepID=A0AAJ0H8G3_9PEZI|nr:hypothetical protein B0T25DRAFT_508249 [Lasiosphaeria hispida]
MYADLDPQTLSLIIQLQLEDVQTLNSSNRKGKNREGDVADFNLALAAYQAELSASAQVIHDRVMCQSMARAVAADPPAIRSAVSEEVQSEQDRDMALRLGGKNPSGRNLKTSRSSSIALAETADAVLERLKAMFVSPPDSGTSMVGEAESSSWAASRPQQGAVTGQKATAMSVCVACGDKFRSFHVVTCSACPHEYCQECLESLFRASFSDETLFPPKCCGAALPLEACYVALPSAVVAEFQEKKVEFETPNRTYCHRPACSTFVPPQSVRGDVATCVKCWHQTCAICKGSSHVGSDCPHDPAVQEMARLAAEQGWQKCFQCARFVELDTGCYHMTCRCGAQFCYLCGEKWKNCGCAQWEEARLLERANAIVNRNAGAARMGAQQRTNLVERERRNLVANHDCQPHGPWRRRGGASRCEECHHYLPDYIFECTQCRIMACRRCLLNRLG